MAEAVYNNKRLVKISGMGPDRQGIVYKIASVIRKAEGNILLQRSMQVAGDFHITVVASFDNGNADAAAEVEGALSLGALGHDFVAFAREIKLANFAHRDGDGSKCVVTASGPDRMGLVESMTLFLLDNNLNVEAMDSKVSNLAEHGTYMFDSVFEITIPEDFDMEKFSEELEQIARNSDLLIQIKRLQ